MPELRRRTLLNDTTAQHLWDWHAAEGAFERLLAPWATADIEQQGRLVDGDETRFRIQFGPTSWRWVARHRDCQPGRGFIDEAVQSPFAHWSHQHSFEDAPGGAYLDDHIDYRLPMGGLGQLVAGGLIGGDLERTFTWRHHRTSWDLQRHRGVPRMRVAITGATGLVGRALTSFLTTGGHEVVRVVRRHPTGSDILWSPSKGELDPESLAGLDAVVHLAGETVAQRWTPEVKRRIHDSRVQGTSLLARSLAACSSPPPVLVSASAIGVYGHRDEDVDESSDPGTGFLAEVGQAWESAADPAREAGLRVVHPRIGVVQASRGGAMKVQLPLFQMGMGGPLGSGEQGLAWVGLDDLVDILYQAIHDPRLEGPVNAVSPHPVSQRTYAKTFGRVLGRPACAPAPAPAIRAITGEMGTEMLLAGAMVRPRKLESLHFAWRHPELEQAMRWELGRFSPEAPPTTIP